MNQQYPPNPWKTKSKKEVYRNPWIVVEDHEAINPSGGESQYGVVKFQNLAVGVVALTEDAQTYLVGQHRYPLDSYSWEIPEGGCPIGTDPLKSAKRELVEETGITAKMYERIATLFLSNSVTDEKAIVYLATDLTMGESEPEPTENITVKKLPFKEAFNMVMAGEIQDAISVAAILKVKLLLEERTP